jgi:hypothetical protein
MLIQFPDEAEKSLKRLQELHPGLTPANIVSRAMTLYHVLYENHLEGNSCPHIAMVMDHLDTQDEQRRKGGQ